MSLGGIGSTSEPASDLFFHAGHRVISGVGLNDALELSGGLLAGRPSGDLGGKLTLGKSYVTAERPNGQKPPSKLGAGGLG
jgi:hypothetical protein